MQSGIPEKFNSGDSTTLECNWGAREDGGGLWVRDAEEANPLPCFDAEVSESAFLNRTIFPRLVYLPRLSFSLAPPTPSLKMRSKSPKVPKEGEGEMVGGRMHHDGSISHQTASGAAMTIQCD